LKGGPLSLKDAEGLKHSLLNEPIDWIQTFIEKGEEIKGDETI
jgi:hypothetical protein